MVSKKKIFIIDFKENMREIHYTQSTVMIYHKFTVWRSTDELNFSN